MRYKPDWPEAERRLTALWHGEPLDRPCINVRAPQEIADPLPLPEPADDEARWLDPDHVVPSALNAIRVTWWGGETLPGVLMMANWVNCLGGTPRFSKQTIWFDMQEVDFSVPSPFRSDSNNPWTCKYKKLLLAMCQAAGRDDFCVVGGGGLPVNDLLSMLMRTETFLMALLDRPEWMGNAIMEGARDRIALKRQMQKLVRETGHIPMGQTGWMPFWAPEPFCSFQSDVSCMLSPELFDCFVLPELELNAEAHGAIWYHLDGGNARQHLPRLLSLPFVRVVQYTPEPGEPPNGPAHLEMYKAIQKAGKIVHVAVPLPNVEPLARALDPSFLMLQTQCACPSQVSEHEFQISADYWHDTRLALRERFGSSLFVLPQCAAAGDQSPHWLVGKAAEMRMLALAGIERRADIARRIADGVAAILPTLEKARLTSPKLACASRVAKLTLSQVPEEAVAEDQKEAEAWREKYDALKRELDAHPEKREEPHWYKTITMSYRRMKWYENVSARSEQAREQPRLPFELHVVRLDDWVWAAHPFELYLDYGMQIRAGSSATQTATVQLAGSGTYLPSERSICGGVYGSVPASNPVGPQSGRELVEHTLDMIRSLWT